MGAIQLRGLHHVALDVVDVAEATQRWCREFGLVERERTAARALLACNAEPYSVELLAAGTAGFDHAAYELWPGVAVSDAVEQLEALGVSYDVGSDDTICLKDPDCQAVHLLAYRAPADRTPPLTRVDPSAPSYGMRRLGHVNSMTSQLEEMTAFYVQVLGMKVSDVLDDHGGVWLRCDRDHHVQALVSASGAHFHHLAFEIVDWSELRVALDHLARQGRWCPWGPLRHSVGCNIAVYVRIPEADCFVELYCDMEQLAVDHAPRHWPDDRRASNLWGMLPPRTYFRFDDAAIEAERTSSVMLVTTPSGSST